jgi:hypothetical protein
VTAPRRGEASERMELRRELMGYAHVEFASLPAISQARLMHEYRLVDFEAQSIVRSEWPGRQGPELGR